MLSFEWTHVIFSASFKSIKTSVVWAVINTLNFRSKGTINQLFFSPLHYVTFPCTTEQYISFTIVSLVWWDVFCFCCRLWAHGNRPWLNIRVVHTDLQLWWVTYSQAGLFLTGRSDRRSWSNNTLTTLKFMQCPFRIKPPPVFIRIPIITRLNIECSC